MKKKIIHIINMWQQILCETGKHVNITLTNLITNALIFSLFKQKLVQNINLHFYFITIF